MALVRFIFTGLVSVVSDGVYSQNHWVQVQLGETCEGICCVADTIMPLRNILSHQISFSDVRNAIARYIYTVF